MKKNIKFIVKILVAAIVALVITMAVDALDVFHYRYAFVSVYAGTAISVAVLLGAFREDGRKGTRYTRIKDAARYGQAAIFVGTAAIFVGTPKECEELADDLQHYAQDARAAELTGNEVFEIL